MAFTVDSLVTLLLIAAFVGVAARRLKLPYTIGLMVSGFVLAFTHLGRHIGITLSRELIFSTLLPPLLFESALNTYWRDVKRDAGITVFLASVGVVVAAGIIAFGMVHWAAWPVGAAIVFGVLLSATDPVAVISLLRETGVTGRIRHLIETESLLNDGTAATLFLVALPLALPGAVAFSATTLFALVFFLTAQIVGGLLIGACVAGLIVMIAGRTTDHLIETTLTAVAAYGSFQAADHLHASGILATVAAGWVLGNFGVLRKVKGDAISERGREVVVAFWDFAAFIANSLVFLLIGVHLARLPFSEGTAWPVVLGILLVLASRVVTVYPTCFLFARGKQGLPTGDRHLLFWGGLRGALALALALSLPDTLPEHDLVVVTTFGVVAFSIIVQGATMPAVIKRLSVHGAKGSISK